LYKPKTKQNKWISCSVQHKWEQKSNFDHRFSLSLSLSHTHSHTHPATTSETTSIWIPDFDLINQVESVHEFVASHAVVDSDGTVTWGHS
jgi:hypothetical protein